MTSEIQIKHPLSLFSTDFVRDPHPYFKLMREHQPVYLARFTRRKPVYLVTRYEDVESLLTDSDRLMKNPRKAAEQSGNNTSFWLPKSFRPLMHNMLNTDEPDHRRLRNLVHKAFTPSMIRNLAPRIETIAEELLDRAAQQEQIDLIRDFAFPLPVTVIAEMLGIPESDREQFTQWARKIVVNPTPLKVMAAVPSIRSFMKYARELADRRRKDPREDVISALALAEEEGDKLSEDELLGTVFLLLVAGHETTVGLISNGVRALLNHPEQLQKLREDPSLMDSAVEELLRYDGPLQTTEMSFARRSFSLHGVDIPQGAMVLPAILSANRDESVFDQADQFDIERSPNKHLAFGKGIHYCLGAPLARMETNIAITALLKKAPNLRLTVDDQELKPLELPLIHRLRDMPVSF